VTGSFRLGAITDEFSTDLAIALAAMREAGLSGVELRLVNGRNILELTDEVIETARAAVTAAGMTPVAIASPLLKCRLPDSGPLDDRLAHDVFGSAFGFDDQPRLARRAFDVAERLGARIIRVFSYWRTRTPEDTFDAVASALRDLAEQAQRRGLVIGLENEYACNVGTGRELADMLARVDHPALQAIWDPANALILGEVAYPDGYSRLPPRRIAHVHVKDCDVTDFRPTWGLVGRMSVNWSDQLRALKRDGYGGWLHLETHWTGPDGDKLEASRLCASALANLAGR
jgi:sugar phosphate isomerase/epimerase